MDYRETAALLWSSPHGVSAPGAPPLPPPMIFGVYTVVPLTYFHSPHLWPQLHLHNNFFPFKHIIARGGTTISD